MDPSELAAFVAACADQPDDDTPLAALADFLDEGGEALDASEIRGHLADAARHRGREPGDEFRALVWARDGEALAYRHVCMLARFADRAARMTDPEAGREEPPAFTKAALRRRGWTPKLLAQFLPKPDREVRNHGSRPGKAKLFDARRVIDVESTEAFLAAYSVRRRVRNRAGSDRPACTSASATAYYDGGAVRMPLKIPDAHETDRP
jgi:uncharacterized protein (TIGR02996 family)